jgi:hypothetical protein
MQIKYLHIVAVLLFAFSQSFAQQQLKYVWLLNEGRYEYINQSQAIPVSLARYDVQNKSYEEMLQLSDVRFGSDLLVTDEFIFMAVDTLLLKLDKFSLNELDRATVRGIRKIAADDEHIYITRGEYLVEFGSYFQYRDIDDLSMVTELDTLNGPRFATEGVGVKDGKVYIAINNGFDFGNEVGFLGMYESNGTYNEYDLGPNGANPDNLMMTENGIYTLNNKDYTGSSVSAVSYDFGSGSTTDLSDVSAGCGTSMYYEDKVIYQEFGEDKLYAFNPSNSSVDDSLELDFEFYGLAADESGNMYATITDFVSSGSLLVFNSQRARVDSVEVGVSAGNLALDYRPTVGIEGNLDLNLKLYPNPTKGNLRLTGDFEIASIRVFNTIGSLVDEREVESGELIWLDLNSGLYILETEVEGKIQADRLIIR